MKIEEGMYVRLRGGYIRRVLEIENSNGYSDIYRLDGDGKIYEHATYNWTRKDLIIKASRNIIDLIEVGDFIDNYVVEQIYDYENGNRTIFLSNGFDEIDDNYILENGVVTHEQFEREAYKV